MKNYTKAKAAHLRLGRIGENIATKLLKYKNYEILARNYKTKVGELDIVARDGETIVFVEVKTRRKLDAYRPADNLSNRQKLRNYKAGKNYLRRIGNPNLPIRYDLIEIITTPLKISSILHHYSYLPTEQINTAQKKNIIL